MTHGYVQDKDALVKRLHRIEGQVRGIERMVEEERYCIDVLTQISAVSTALESLSVKLLEDHVRHCVADARGALPPPRPMPPSSASPGPASRRLPTCHDSLPVPGGPARTVGTYSRSWIFPSNVRLLTISSETSG